MGNRESSATHDFDPYERWLRIPRDRRPPTACALLGLPEGVSDPQRIHAAAAERYHLVRPYAAVLDEGIAECADRVLTEIAQAVIALTQTPPLPASTATGAGEPPVPSASRTPTQTDAADASRTPTWVDRPAAKSLDEEVAAWACPAVVRPPPVAPRKTRAAPVPPPVVRAPASPSPAPATPLSGPTGRARRWRRAAAAAVRRIDRLLGVAAGPDNVILHGFLRVFAVVGIVASAAATVGFGIRQIQAHREAVRVQIEQQWQRERILAAQQAVRETQQEVAANLQTDVRPDAYTLSAQKLSEAAAALDAGDLDQVELLLKTAAVLLDQAANETPAANALGQARVAWSRSLAQADHDLLEKHAHLRFARAQQKIEAAPTQPLTAAGMSAVMACYQEAQDLLKLALAEAQQAQTELATKQRAETTSLAEQVRTALDQRDLAAAQELLAKLQAAAPPEPRLGELQQQLARLEGEPSPPPSEPGGEQVLASPLDAREGWELPPPATAADAGERRTLGTLLGEPPSPCELQLDGPGVAALDGQIFHLSPPTDTAARRTWKVFLGPPVGDLAHLELLAEFALEQRTLSFAWQGLQGSLPAQQQLQNTVLTINCGDRSGQVALRKPQVRDRLTLDLRADALLAVKFDIPDFPRGCELALKVLPQGLPQDFPKRLPSIRATVGKQEPGREPKEVRELSRRQRAFGPFPALKETDRLCWGAQTFASEGQLLELRVVLGEVHPAGPPPSGTVRILVWAELVPGQRVRRILAEEFRRDPRKSDLTASGREPAYSLARLEEIWPQTLASWRYGSARWPILKKDHEYWQKVVGTLKDRSQRAAPEEQSRLHTALSEATERLHQCENERRWIEENLPSLRDKSEVCAALIGYLEEFEGFQGRIVAKYETYQLELVRFSAHVPARANNPSKPPPH